MTEEDERALSRDSRDADRTQKRPSSERRRLSRQSENRPPDGENTEAKPDEDPASRTCSAASTAENEENVDSTSLVNRESSGGDSGGSISTEQPQDRQTDRPFVR